MNNTAKRICMKQAKKTLKKFIKARKNPKFNVVGKRHVTRKEKNLIIKGYVNVCIKDSNFVSHLKKTR